MTGINDITNLTQGTDPKDLFAFKLSYNTVTNAPTTNSVPLYNGNISEAYWRTNSDNIKRKYSYEYDNLNRLNNAIYLKPDQATAPTNSYNESMQYDKNGNIIALQRKGNYDDAVNTLQIDNLNYFYDTTNNIPNKLLKVNDLTNNTSGFKDGTNTNDDFGYDANGNMTSDQNKAITSIKYNHLNLPTEIIFYNLATRKITYLYNTDGTKLQKIVTNGTAVTTTDYLYGFQYTSTGTAAAQLKYFPTSEGYVSVTLSGGVASYNYIFNYTDHLGNVRLSYGYGANSSGVNDTYVLQENNYYPFGLQHTNYNTTKLVYDNIGSQTKIGPPPLNYPLNLYAFNGKEYQNELGLNDYDFGARNYDPAIGRWMNIDPLAETSRRISPYVYALNNPVYFIDPDGMDEEEFDGWGLGDDGIWHYEKTLNENNYSDKGYREYAADGTTRHGAAIEYSDGSRGENGDVYLGFNKDDFYYIDSRTIENENAREALVGEEITDSQLDTEDHSLSENILEYTNELMAITISIDGGADPVSQDATIIEDILGNAIAGLVYVGEVVNGLNILDSFAQRGNNDKRLEPEELDRILSKSAGERTSEEKQKLKAHEKSVQQRGSRHSKGGKNR